MIDTTTRRRHAESLSDAVIAANIHDLRRGASPERQLRDNRHFEKQSPGGYASERCREGSTDEHAALRLRAVA